MQVDQQKLAAPLPNLRTADAPLASQSDATIDRLDGRWIVVEGVGINHGFNLNFSGSRVRIDNEEKSVTSLGEGRFLFGEDPVWVHWLDVNNRTAAMGDPNGTRVWIMDRTGAPGDRLKAAREILEWYGYDLSRLQRP